MKHFFVILLAIIFAGCNLAYNPNSRPSAALYLTNVIWTADGSKVIALADSTASDGTYHRRVRIYDKTGTLIQSYLAPEIYYGNYSNGENSIWQSNDDSTFFYADYGGAYGDYLLLRYSYISGTSGYYNSAIAGGIIYAESADRNHLFIGPSYSQSSLNNFLIMDFSGNIPRLQRTLTDHISQYPNAVWMGNKSVGYFRYNNLNLIDFVIRDTNGSKLDSFDITGTMTGEKSYYDAGTIYFVGYGGILKIDSAAKTNAKLSEDFIRNSDIAADASFITYITYSKLKSFNPKTSVSKDLSDKVGHYLKISPLNNMLAYIDQSTPSFDKLVIIPVSAP